MRCSFLDECKRLVRSKFMFVLLFILPVAITLIVGFELSDGALRDIRLTVFDNDKSNFSRTVIGYFDSFFEIEYAESSGGVENAIASGGAGCGMIIPQDFEKDITLLRSPTIVMLYDGSNLSITGTAKAKATEILATIRTGAAIKHIESRAGMSRHESEFAAMPIMTATRDLYIPTKNFQYFLLPGIALAISQTAIALSVVLCASYHRGKSKIGYASGKLAFYLIAGFLVFFINIEILINVFHIPVTGSVINIFALCLLLALTVSMLSLLITTWIEDKFIATTGVAVLIVPNMIMSGYTWPVISMPPIYQDVALLIPYYHVAENVRRIMFAGDAGAISLDCLFLIIAGLILFAGCVLGLVFNEKRGKCNEVG